MGRQKRRRVEHTEDWEQMELLCVHDEQVEFTSPVIPGGSAACRLPSGMGCMCATSRPIMNASCGPAGTSSLKALGLEEYAARSQRRPEALQGALFSYLDAL